MIPLWLGSANTWDCDEMGHMNVRVYVEKAMEGLGILAHAIEMPHAFRPNAPSTLLLREHHIRFIREAHPGKPLRMNGCVLDFDDSSALIYQELRHGDGTPAASFRTRMTHIEARSGKVFPWSTRTQKALSTLMDTPPADTAPRGIDPNVLPLPDDDATMASVTAVNAPLIGQGIVPPQHCDVFGRMAPPWFMGRISDSVPNLLHAWRNTVAASVEGAQTGAAVLEYRLIYRAWPRAGDAFAIHSGLSEVGEKTHSLTHWVLDPFTGRPWATTQAVAVTFDLNTRKVIPTPAEAMRKLEEIAPKGLQL